MWQCKVDIAGEIIEIHGDNSANEPNCQWLTREEIAKLEMAVIDLTGSYADLAPYDSLEEAERWGE